MTFYYVYKILFTYSIQYNEYRQTFIDKHKKFTYREKCDMIVHVQYLFRRLRSQENYNNKNTIKQHNPRKHYL